ncbi:MAG: hypothetical protein AAGK04_12045 [Planctomycetota bacterium]
MIFSGKAELTIDAQGRVQIPAKIRAAWNPEIHGDHWTCIPWPEQGGMLRLFPVKTFTSIGAATPNSLTTSGQASELEAQIFGMAEPLRPDKADRVKLPQDHIDLVGLPKEVVLLGVRDRLEIRDRAAWKNAFKDTFQNLPRLAKEMHAGPSQASPST